MEIKDFKKRNETATKLIKEYDKLNSLLKATEGFEANGYKVDPKLKPDVEIRKQSIEKQLNQIFKPFLKKQKS